MDEGVYEKIYKEVKRLYSIDDNLFDALDKAGEDAETIYTEGYLDVVLEMRSLQEAVHSLLSEHINTFNEIEWYIGPENRHSSPNKIPNQPAFNDMDTIARLAGY